jgi:hypothetical protein
MQTLQNARPEYIQAGNSDEAGNDRLDKACTNDPKEALSLISRQTLEAQASMKPEAPKPEARQQPRPDERQKPGFMTPSAPEGLV